MFAISHSLYIYPAGGFGAQMENIFKLSDRAFKGLTGKDKVNELRSLCSHGPHTKLKE